jgi:capsular exopolysaccharide synthesis family protein
MRLPAPESAYHWGAKGSASYAHPVVRPRGNLLELRDYLRILRKAWPLVLVFVVVGSALGVVLTVSTPKVYQATVQVFVATSAGTTAADLANGNTFSQDRVQSYTSIANGPSVTGPVVQKLGLNLTAQELAAKISADAPQNKVLINLHVTDGDPQRAAVLANAVAAQFDSVVQSTEQTDVNGKPVVKLTVIHPATVPGAPIKPSKTINIGLGLLIGLLVGVGLVVMRDVLDNTVKGPEDFEALGAPVLGYVPFDKRTTKAPIAFRDDPHGSRSEAYRLLRTNLQFVNIDDAPRIIAVTSAMPGEGKTITALNLAVALAEAGYRVCLVETDLRRPTLAKSLDLVGDVGFTTALIRQAPVETVLQNAGRNLAVLTSGPVPPNPSELLISVHARQLIEEIAAKVDYTILDTAPLLAVADGAEIAALADATLLVHRAGKTTRDQAARAVEALAKVGKRPVGVVLNMIVRARGQSDYEYGYYYAAYRPERSRRATSASNGREASHEAGTGPLSGAPTGSKQASAEAEASGEASAGPSTAEPSTQAPHTLSYSQPIRFSDPPE